MGVLHMLKSVTDTICESFVYEGDGAVMVVDGGFESESERLYEKLKELGGRVTGWFFTHPHDDHFGAFCKLMEDHADEIRVENLYYNFLPDELLFEHDKNFAPEAAEFLRRIRTLSETCGIRHVNMQRGDEYTLGDARIKVLRVPNPYITRNIYNNSSVVFRMDVNDKRVLFLGDLGEEGGDDLLNTVDAAEIRCDYVQMAHHGQNGVKKNVYEAAKADYCLWCTPTWLWDNMGENGYDSGPFRTVVVRGWMSEIKAKKHYVNMNGPYAIEL